MKLPEGQKQQLLSECNFTATKSSGPGGQNVNKVSSRIELRFSVHDSKFLDETEKERIRSKLKNRLNSGDELILVSQSERSQLRNKQKAIEMFYRLLEKALTVSKKRIQTSPTLTSQEKRLETKKRTAQKKQMRKPPEM